MKVTLLLRYFFLLLFFVIASLGAIAQTADYEKEIIIIDGQEREVYRPASKKTDIQPIQSLLGVGDNCMEPINVTLNGDAVQHSLEGATNSGIMPSCATSSDIRDIWFVSQADANGTIDVSWQTPNHQEEKVFGVTIWSDCQGSAESVIFCRDAPIVTSGLSTGFLSPNQTVYIQVWAYQPTMQEVVIDIESQCIINNINLLSQVCDETSFTYSQEMFIDYYTLLDNPMIEVRDINFNLIYTVAATQNPQTITIPNLPANGLNQEYYMGLGLDGCSYRHFNWQAPASDCSNKGSDCTNPIELTTSFNYEEVCTNLSIGSIVNTLPCTYEESRSIKNLWFKAQADDLGALVFTINESSHQSFQAGWILYDDCNNLVSCSDNGMRYSLTVAIPEASRVANKVWYLQVWAYVGEESGVCASAFPDCSITTATLGEATCTNEQTFSQEITIEHFNIPVGAKLRIRDIDQNYTTVYETDISTSPQTITVPNLNATLETINLYIGLNNRCFNQSLRDIPTPDCGGGNSEISGYVLEEYLGFSIYTEQIAINTDASKTTEAVNLLKSKLEGILHLGLTSEIEERLKAVKFFVDWQTNDNAIAYHYSRDWLIDNGYIPEKAESIEIPNLNNFIYWSAQNQPDMVTALLAYAYQHQVLGLENSMIEAAYNNAVNTGIYQSVSYHAGNNEYFDRTAHALTSKLTYFSELTESYLGENEFFPFTRSELETYDPQGFELMQSIWLFDCPQTLSLEDTISQGTYRANSTITANGLIRGSNVLFEAGTSITLEDGFHATVGNNFSAIIKACEPASLSEEFIPVEQRIVNTDIVENTLSGGLTQQRLTIAPNPAHSIATITYELAGTSPVQLDLYTLTGQKVKTLLQHSLVDTGKQEASINLSNIDKGIYFIMLKTKVGVTTEKIVVY